MLNTGTSSKSSQQFLSIVTELLKHNVVIGSEQISIHTITSYNEASVALACDLLTNYVDSVLCVVQKLALCVKDVFTDGSSWEKCMDHVNKANSFFKYHGKAKILFIEKQKAIEVTNNRLHRLKHNFPTLWHFHLGVMLTCLTDFDHIPAVKNEIKIDDDSLPPLTPDDLGTLAEVLKVLAEVRRVARQLEADQKLILSRSLRLFRELYETLRIMGYDMDHNTSKYFHNEVGSVSLHSQTTHINYGHKISLSSI